MAVIDRVGSTRGRSIISGHLIDKGVEGVAVRVKYGRSQSSAGKIPRLVGAARSRVGIFDVLMVAILTGNNRQQAGRAVIDCTSLVARVVQASTYRECTATSKASVNEVAPD